MYTKSAITVIIVSYTVYLSVCKYLAMSKRCDLYRTLEKFAVSAEQNLNGAFLNISEILSSTFNTQSCDKIDYALIHKLGFEKNDAEKIMEYTIRYTYQDIETLRDSARQFNLFASEARNKSELDFQKRLPTLLCPPVFAFIVLIILT